MAKGIEHVGDTGLTLNLEFLDDVMRDDFEIAFRGWLKEYKLAATTNGFAKALAHKVLSRDEDEDVSGHLLFYYDSKTYRTYYLDFI